tara:strand:- start:79 stop:180 length:102 start_codon:yes stop_codon:yes gene_type:complete
VGEILIDMKPNKAHHQPNIKQQDSERTLQGWQR